MKKGYGYGTVLRMKIARLISCLALLYLLPTGLAAQATSSSGSQYFKIIERNRYANGHNDPYIPGECLPIKNGFVPPTFGQACRKYVDGNLSSGGSGSSSGGSSGSSTSGSGSSGGGATGNGANAAVFGNGGGSNGNNFSSGADINSSSSNGSSSGTNSSSSGADTSSSGADTSSSSGSSTSSGGVCPPVDQMNEIPCDANQACTQDCVNGTPICLNYDTNCGCTEWKTPQNCHCAPTCVIPDPNYPFCCQVDDKPGYPCLKVCTMPSGDKVDIEQNPPRCKKFKDCCYGEKDAQNNCIKSWDPVETQPGDPRDYCKLKCVDVCEDTQEVDRSKTASDIFPQCCTPPIPIQVACACCRDGAGNKPSDKYCSYFRRFFNCDDATLACPNDPDLKQCVMTVDKKQSYASGPDPVLPEYDVNHDPYLTFDPRYAFCSGEWTNRNCRYICRGKGILMGADAPTEGIWVKDYIDDHGNPIENNYALEVHGNCTEEQEQEKPVPWPPANQDLEECGAGSITTLGNGVGVGVCLSTP